jgi:general nucleoside transport system permease protein
MGVVKMENQNSKTTIDAYRNMMSFITGKHITGALLGLLGVFMVISANLSFDFSVTTILTLEPGSVEDVPHIVVPTLAYLSIVGLIFLTTGLLTIVNSSQLESVRRGFIITCGVILIPALLVAAAANGRTNITTMFSESLRLATPIAIGAMAGIWCERSGVVNIAIEGMMLVGAAAGFTALFYLYPLYPDQTGWVLLFSVLVAILAGGLTSLLHAWLSITFRTDQIVSGTVINIMALGATSFVRREYLVSTQAGITRLPSVRIPILADIPIVGEAFFDRQPIFYMMFVVIIATHIMLFHTRWGLRMRAVGEHPHAADTLGINVNRTRWTSVFVGGLIAGLAGAWFSLEATGRFSDNMTHGAGFIALAAMIFGKWTPFGAFGAALLFGFSDALGVRLQSLDVPVPNQWLQMVPYVVTIIVLAGFIGKASAPKASGKPYVKE